ncbi:MAG: hypothetical protein WCP95_16250 [Actinomycetes bacterium]
MEQSPRAQGSRGRDFWQLDVPLVVVLALCTLITVIEVRRATEGVWRAWFYMFEWPLIGAFAVWIWYRYRHQGSVTRGLVDGWRDRVRQYEAEADAEDAVTRDVAPRDAASRDADPELAAWRDYVEDLQRREPPGESPSIGKPD